MIVKLLLALSIFVILPYCQTRLDFLTPAECEKILETLPEFKAAEAHGECPGFDGLPQDNPRLFSVQMRGRCPPPNFAGSMLIGNFTVDRRTGVVSAAYELPVSRALAVSLLAHVRNRVLTQREAECLAKQAARDELNSDTPVSAQTNQTDDPKPMFTVTRQMAGPARATELFIEVDTRSMAVLTGDDSEIHSPGVDKLVSQMRAIREAPSLTVAQAIEIAMQAPAIAARTSAKCSSLSADLGTSSRRFVDIENTCENSPREILAVAAVDIQTGAVTEPRTGKAMDTPESRKLAWELLSKAEERQSATRKQIEDACQ